MHVQFRSNIDSKKLPPSLIGSLFTEQTFLSPMSIFSKYLNHRWKFTGQKGNFHTVMVIIFLNLAMFQQRPDWPQVKQNVICSIANLLYELRHKIPNELRLRILGSKEIWGECYFWVEKWPSVLPPFQKLNIGYGSQRFLSYQFLLDFYSLFQIFCPRSSEETTFWS